MATTQKALHVHVVTCDPSDKNKEHVATKRDLVGIRESRTVTCDQLQLFFFQFPNKEIEKEIWKKSFLWSLGGVFLVKVKRNENGRPTRNRQTVDFVSVEGTRGWPRLVCGAPFDIDVIDEDKV